jgi:hypothetical protein
MAMLSRAAEISLPENCPIRSRLGASHTEIYRISGKKTSLNKKIIISLHMTSFSSVTISLYDKDKLLSPTKTTSIPTRQERRLSFDLKRGHIYHLQLSNENTMSIPYTLSVKNCANTAPKKSKKPSPKNLSKNELISSKKRAHKKRTPTYRKPKKKTDPIRKKKTIDTNSQKRNLSVSLHKKPLKKSTHNHRLPKFKAHIHSKPSFSSSFYHLQTHQFHHLTIHHIAAKQDIQNLFFLSSFFDEKKATKYSFSDLKRKNSFNSYKTPLRWKSAHYSSKNHTYKIKFQCSKKGLMFLRCFFRKREKHFQKARTSYDCTSVMIQYTN